MRLPFAQLVPLLRFRGAHFWFNSVHFLSKKKSKQTEIKKKIRNRFKPTGFGLVRFFRKKTGLYRFGSVFLAWLGFCLLFFQFDLGFF